ncbi:sialate O-acetylesterase-like [Salmo trutta]|uniref:sialate O-acetylesterase-like n=1 Tax=Salmo trutta TaxID=8032 RepID=UPI0011327CBB|nr:sialate O-acetylesterase-like [Salmo trutta]
MEAGGPYNVTAVLQNNHSITLTDVLFGDVWLCGGQSNMAFTTSLVFNASEELALASKFLQVRIFMAALEQSYTELTDLAGVEMPWSVPTAKLLGGRDFKHYSAVCWMFGRHLYKALKYPIGLVTSCWGGTPVEAWSSPRALQHCDLDRINGIPIPYTPSMHLSKRTNSVVECHDPSTSQHDLWYQGFSTLIKGVGPSSHTAVGS